MVSPLTWHEMASPLPWPIVRTMSYPVDGPLRTFSTDPAVTETIATAWAGTGATTAPTTAPATTAAVTDLRISAPLAASRRPRGGRRTDATQGTGVIVVGFREKS